MTLVKLEVPELSVIEESKAVKIKATFEPMVAMLEQFEDQYNEILTESQKEITGELTQKAKSLRIGIGKVRIETDKLRRAEKEEYLRAGKAIDGVSNILKWAVVEKENKLKEIEDYFEIQEQKRLEALQTERAELLSPFVEDAHERKLAEMEPDVWDAYLSAKKKEYEDRIEAERKAEQERIEREKAEAAERERIRKENERLAKEIKLKERLAKIEAEKREKAEKERLAKEAAERKEREEKERKEREAYEAKLKKEREERERIEREERAKREKLEAELKAKKEAEQKEKQRLLDEEMAKKKAEKAALLAPDKDKLLALAKRIDNIELPELNNKEAKHILDNIIALLSKTTGYIREKANEL
jgi:hypothetical protein